MVRFENACLSDFPKIPEIESFLAQLAGIKTSERKKREFIPGSGFGTRTFTETVCETLAGIDGLVIVGEVGRGKTHLAWALLRAIPAHIPRHIASAMKIVEQARLDVAKGETPHNYAEDEVLFLDDISAIRPTDFALDTITAIIRRRYDAMLPTVVTTHAGYDTLAEMYGAAVASRVLELGPIVKLNGPDRRRIKVAG